MDWETDEEEEVMKASRESFIPCGTGWGVGTYVLHLAG